MSEETRIQLTLDTGGSVPAVAKLREEIEQLKEVLQKQAQAYADGDLPLEVFIRGNQAARTVIGQLEGALVSITPKIEEMAGSDVAGRGFASLASNVIKAEKAFGALAGMGGLGRAGPMLESVLLSLGGPAGLGLAIGAVALAAEKYGPQIAKFFDLFDAEKIKAAEEHLKKLTDEIDKVQNAPSKAEKARSEQVKEFFGGQDVRGDIASALELTGRGARATKEELAGLDLGNILGTTGLGGAQGVEEQERRRQAIRERVQKENVRLASEMMDRAMQAGPGGERGLGEIAGLAEQAPDSFAPAFGRNLRMFTPAAEKERKEMARAETEAAKQADEWAKQRKLGISLTEQGRANEEAWRKQMEKETDARRKRVEHKQHVQDEGIIDQANEEEREKTQAAHDAARQARENTPEKLKQRAIDAEIRNQGGGQADPDFVRQVARQASSNVTMGADIATAVNFAVQQVQAKIFADFQRGMARQRVMSEGP